MKDWNEKLKALNFVLADLYPFREESRRVVKKAGLNAANIPFNNKAIDNWYYIIEEALKTNLVLSLIDAALEDYSDNPVLIQARKAELAQRPTLSGLLAPEPEKDLLRKSSLTIDDLEKIMGTQSTFLPISFLEVGTQRARSVVRVRLAKGEIGSGILTTGNVLVTNHHVIANEEDALGATAQFNYQKTANGLDLEPVNFSLDPDGGFATSAKDDWTLVRIKGDANSAWGAIELTTVKITEAQRVNIIQHPEGGPKQIALYHNIVTYADERRIQYLTDTLPGSSGSPVFNDQWQVVALHHSGGWILEPATKKPVFRNEGININLIVDARQNHGMV